MNHPRGICPVCEDGVLTPESFEARLKYEGRDVLVPNLERNRCNRCGADPVRTDQIRRNQVRIADAKRRVVGLLSGDEIRGVRELLGLSQHDASQIFGGGANAFSKYERGEVLQSAPMDKLLRVVAANPWLIQQLGKSPTTSDQTEDSSDDNYADIGDVAVPTAEYPANPARAGRVIHVSSSVWQRAA